MHHIMQEQRTPVKMDLMGRVQQTPAVAFSIFSLATCDLCSSRKSTVQILLAACGPIVARTNGYGQRWVEWYGVDQMRKSQEGKKIYIATKCFLRYGKANMYMDGRVQDGVASWQVAWICVQASVNVRSSKGWEEMAKFWNEVNECLTEGVG